MNLTDHDKPKTERSKKTDYVRINSKFGGGNWFQLLNMCCRTVVKVEGGLHTLSHRFRHQSRRNWPVWMFFVLPMTSWTPSDQGPSCFSYKLVIYAWIIMNAAKSSLSNQPITSIASFQVCSLTMGNPPCDQWRVVVFVETKTIPLNTST